MSTEPDRIRQEIQGTQGTLSADVHALTEKVSPGRVVRRRADRVRAALAGARDTVMGSASRGASRAGDAITSAASDVGESASAAGHRVSAAASSAGEQASSAASTAAGAVEAAPQAVRRQTRGNPLAAGLIAFGAGWLVFSLLPPTRRERDAAARAEDAIREHAPPVGSQLGQLAAQVTDDLREPARDAAESVRSTASQAASTVAHEARSGVDDVAGRAQQASEAVRERADSSTPS